MKKYLLFALVFAVIVCPAFAAADAKAKSVEMTTITQEMSQSMFPGVLVPGSITGLDTYLSDLTLLSNTVLFEYLEGDTIGMILVKTDLGTIGASIAPGIMPDLDNIHMSVPQDALGLMYANKIGSMPFGAGILYSSHRFTYENQNLSGFTPPGNRDFRNDYDSFLSLRSGFGLGGFDLGANVTLLNNSKKTSYYAGANWDYDYNYDTTSMKVDVSGRMKLAGDFTTSATISFLGAEDNARYLDNGTDESDKWTNSILTLGAVIGKDLKMTETFSVKIAAGFNIGGYTNGKFEYIDNLDESNSYLGFTGSGDGDRTQYGYWYVPLNVAVETKLNDTWTLNSGIVATIVGFNNTHSMLNTSALIGKEMIVERFISSSIDIQPGLDYAVGLSGKIGDLRIDLHLNPEIFLNGPYFISGDDLTGGMNSSIAVSYSWN